MTLLALAPHGPVVVTGTAGFLGSHLSERLLDEGRDVIGVDCFTPYYAREIKERNLARLLDEPAFTLVELDLARDSLAGFLDGVDTVFHLAAQPGVRGSFGDGFDAYVTNNVLATQRLLEEAARAAVGAFVYASSSSVYGDAARHPTTERSPRRPVSPYGMTKVSVEELAGVYLRCHGVPAVGLRYFTAYGPRQRPDMAFSRFIARALEGRAIPVHGDGRQVRDFTFVADVVEATVAAAALGTPGEVYNVGGGAPVELRDAIAMLGELLERPVDVERLPAPVGEAWRTGCDGELARRELGFSARTTLAQGLAAQLEWTLAARDRRAKEAVAA
jgi:UDP-glucuronate 4-epimerase